VLRARFPFSPIVFVSAFARASRSPAPFVPFSFRRFRPSSFVSRFSRFAVRRRRFVRFAFVFFRSRFRGFRLCFRFRVSVASSFRPFRSFVASFSFRPFRSSFFPFALRSRSLRSSFLSSPGLRALSGVFFVAIRFRFVRSFVVFSVSFSFSRSRDFVPAPDSRLFVSFRRFFRPTFRLRFVRFLQFSRSFSSFVRRRFFLFFFFVHSFRLSPFVGRSRGSRDSSQFVVVRFIASVGFVSPSRRLSRSVSSVFRLSPGSFVVRSVFVRRSFAFFVFAVVLSVRVRSFVSFPSFGVSFRFSRRFRFPSHPSSFSRRFSRFSSSCVSSFSVPPFASFRFSFLPFPFRRFRFAFPRRPSSFRFPSFVLFGFVSPSLSRRSRAFLSFATFAFRVGSFAFVFRSFVRSRFSFIIASARRSVRSFRASFVFCLFGSGRVSCRRVSLSFVRSVSFVDASLAFRFGPFVRFLFRRFVRFVRFVRRHSVAVRFVVPSRVRSLRSVFSQSVRAGRFFRSFLRRRSVLRRSSSLFVVGRFVSSPRRSLSRVVAHYRSASRSSRRNFRALSFAPRFRSFRRFARSRSLSFRFFSRPFPSSFPSFAFRVRRASLFVAPGPSVVSLPFVLVPRPVASFPRPFRWLSAFCVVSLRFAFPFPFRRARSRRFRSLLLSRPDSSLRSVSSRRVRRLVGLPRSVVFLLSFGSPPCLSSSRSFSFVLRVFRASVDTCFRSFAPASSSFSVFHGVVFSSPRHSPRFRSRRLRFRVRLRSPFPFVIAVLSRSGSRLSFSVLHANFVSSSFVFAVHRRSRSAVSVFVRSLSRSAFRFRAASVGRVVSVSFRVSSFRPFRSFVSSGFRASSAGPFLVARAPSFGSLARRARSLFGRARVYGFARAGFVALSRRFRFRRSCVLRFAYPFLVRLGRRFVSRGSFAGRGSPFRSRAGSPPFVPSFAPSRSVPVVSRVSSPFPFSSFSFLPAPFFVRPFPSVRRRSRPFQRFVLRVGVSGCFGFSASVPPAFLVAVPFRLRSFRRVSASRSFASARPPAFSVRPSVSVRSRFVSAVFLFRFAFPVSAFRTRSPRRFPPFGPCSSRLLVSRSHFPVLSVLSSPLPSSLAFALRSSVFVGRSRSVVSPRSFRFRRRASPVRVVRPAFVVSAAPFLVRHRPSPSVPFARFPPVRSFRSSLRPFPFASRRSRPVRRFARPRSFAFRFAVFALFSSPVRRSLAVGSTIVSFGFVRRSFVFHRLVVSSFVFVVRRFRRVIVSFVRRVVSSFRSFSFRFFGALASSFVVALFRSCVVVSYRFVAGFVAPSLRSFISRSFVSFRPPFVRRSGSVSGSVLSSFLRLRVVPSSVVGSFFRPFVRFRRRVSVRRCFVPVFRLFGRAPAFVRFLRLRFVPRRPPRQRVAFWRLPAFSLACSLLSAAFRFAFRFSLSLFGFSPRFRFAPAFGVSAHSGSRVSFVGFAFARRFFVRAHPFALAGVSPFSVAARFVSRSSSFALRRFVFVLVVAFAFGSASSVSFRRFVRFRFRSFVAFRFVRTGFRRFRSLRRIAFPFVRASVRSVVRRRTSSSFAPRRSSVLAFRRSSFLSRASFRRFFRSRRRPFFPGHPRRFPRSFPVLPVSPIAFAVLFGSRSVPVRSPVSFRSPSASFRLSRFRCTSRLSFSSFAHLSRRVTRWPLSLFSSFVSFVLRAVRFAVSFAVRFRVPFPFCLRRFVFIRFRFGRSLRFPFRRFVLSFRLRRRSFLVLRSSLSSADFRRSFVRLVSRRPRSVRPPLAFVSFRSVSRSFRPFFASPFVRSVRRSVRFRALSVLSLFVSVPFLR